MMTVKERQNLNSKGEISGAFLLGLIQSFHDLNVLPQVGLNLKDLQIKQEEWYPYQMFIDVLNDIRSKKPADPVFFQAGINFLKIWYEFGPGKKMIFSGLDWLYANQSSGGYNSVVQGGTRDEIGWCLLQSIDLEKGIAIYENVTPLPAEFVKGVFYGGCALFNDMDYFEVTADTEVYPPNPAFFRLLLSVNFHFRAEKDELMIEQKLLNWPSSAEQLTKEEVDCLIWQYKALKVKNKHETEYNLNINGILATAIKTSQRNERELIFLNKELEAFSYSVSHDLRAPLRAISGYANIVEEDYAANLDKDGIQALNAISKNAKRMGALIDDLLAFSRLGRKELNTTELNMNALVNFLAREQMDDRLHASVKLNIEVHELMVANADAALIKQVWINLISNAIKYSMFKPEIKIEIGSYLENNTIVYFVKDNGVGFDMAYYDKLFGVFQRLHSNEEFEGTGIGLAIVQKIVSRHHGNVWAESKVNEGSCFYFSLPHLIN